MVNRANRESRTEEYIRRMRALGYEPSLAGMDDADIEWELNKMDEAGRRQEAPPQPTRTMYRPVDPGLAARVLRQMGRPYDPRAISPRESFYLNGWDDEQDEEDEAYEPAKLLPESEPLQGGVKDAGWDSDPWAKAWRPDWGEGGNLRTADYRASREGMPRARMMDFLARREDIRPKVQPLAAMAGDGGENLSGAASAGGMADFRLGEERDSQKTSEIPAGNMKPSDQLASYLKTYEKFIDKPYQVSPSDPPTIGFGHVILPGEDFSGGITEERAHEVFKKDMEEKAAIVNDWARESNVKLTQQQYDALVSFVFNLGSIGVEGETQTIADTIKRGNATPDEIRKAFGLYTNNKDGEQPGLVSRRRDEADMFLNGDYKRKD